MTPVIILVRPQMGENIGAAARAMANFGLRELRLVSPRDGWPNERANALAGHALEVVQNAKVFATASEAVADLQLTFATSARDRSMQKPVMEPHEAAQQMHATKDLRCGVLFGPERTGLENEELASADAVLTVATDADCPSLNLSHAVGIFAYAWSLGAERQRAVVDEQTQKRVARDEENGHVPASKEQLEGMFTHLEQALDGSDYWKEPTKKPYMWRNIRATLTRARMSAAEVQTWRGLIRALVEGGD